MAVIDSAELLLQAKNYSGTGDWLDEANSHDAQFGTGTPGTNDPQWLGWDGDNYVYFPGVAGNTVAVTLSPTTIYDYEVTYEDDTTDTGTETSDGAGVVTFGGTDAKFDSLKVKLIDVYPDGGGATLALFDASLATEPFATLTDSIPEVWTFNRSGAGLYVVDRPAFGLHTDDYFEIADHADLDFADGEDFTFLVVARVGTAASFGLLASKLDASQFGYRLSYGASGLEARVLVQDTASGTTNDEAGTATLRTTYVHGGRRDDTTPELEAFFDGTGSGTPSATATADLSNAGALSIGYGAFNYYTGEVMAVALWRSALSDADVATAGDELLALTELQTVIRPIADTTGTGWDSAPTGSQALYLQVDEAVASDTDYIFTEDPNP